MRARERISANKFGKACSIVDCDGANHVRTAFHYGYPCCYDSRSSCLLYERHSRSQSSVDDDVQAQISLKWQGVQVLKIILSALFKLLPGRFLGRLKSGAFAAPVFYESQVVIANNRGEPNIFTE